jgi:hypothetical protein
MMAYYRMLSSLSMVAVVIDPLLLYRLSLLNRDVIFFRPSPGKKSFIIIKRNYRDFYKINQPASQHIS